MRQRLRRALLLGGGGVAAVVALLLSLLSGTGLLYELRGTGMLSIGPRIADSLPLLQLAGFDGQPLARVAVAWLAAGVVLGTALIRVRPLPRTVLVAVLGMLLLLFASDASFALARNLRLSRVLAHRSPGLGPWLEALLLTAGCALPRPLGAIRRPAPWSQRARRIAVPGRAT